MQNNFLKKFWTLVMLLMISGLIVSCDKKDEEDAKPVLKPTATFTFAPTAPKVGDAVVFTNTSLNALTYSWDFGDGANSTDKNPSHTYTKAGSYDVTLTSKSEKEEAKTTSKVTVEAIAVVNPPVANFTYAPQSITAGQEVTFTNSSKDAVSYSWDFGDGQKSTEKDAKNTYATAGSFKVKLTATGSDGKTSQKEQTLTVKAVAVKKYSVKMISMKITEMDILGGTDLPVWNKPYIGVFDISIDKITKLDQAVWIAKFSDEGIKKENLPITLPLDLSSKAGYELKDLTKSLYFFLGAESTTTAGSVDILLYHEVKFQEYATERPTTIELKSEEDKISYTLTVEWKEI